MTIAEIAVQMGADPADTILELVERSGARAGAIFFGIREEDLEHALTLPWTSIGSDGSALAPVGELAQSHPHPAPTAPSHGCWRATCASAAC